MLTAVSLLLLPTLLAATALSLFLGRRLGERQLTRAGGARAETAGIEAAVSGLLSLLLAFTVSGAANRLDERRKLIVDESNAIGTAWLRLDLLPAAAQPGLRAQFRAYADSRIAVYHKLPELAAVEAEMRRSQELQRAIWAAAISGFDHERYSAAPIVLLPALNQMIDLASMRNMIRKLHPPPLVFGMLLTVMLTSALYAGFSLGRTRSFIHVVGYVVLNVFVFVVILDLEYPRAGILREDPFDQALVDVRSGMN